MRELILVLVSVFVGAIGQLSLKYGSTTNPALKSLFLNWYTSAGLLLYVVSAFLWILALRRIELSIAYPFVSIGYIVVIVGSYFIFNEQVNLMKIAGIIFILIGIVFIARS
jgi:multidrug transporter EmrE-like cation transporter